MQGFNRNRHIVLSRPIKLNDSDFDTFYDQISDHWLDRARSLRKRRLRQLENQEL